MFKVPCTPADENAKQCLESHYCMDGDKLVVGHRTRKVLILKRASGTKGQSGAILS